MSTLLCPSLEDILSKSGKNVNVVSYHPSLVKRNFAMRISINANDGDL